METNLEQSLLFVVRNERQRWYELRQFALKRHDMELMMFMDEASRRYGERSRAGVANPLAAGGRDAGE